ncbi:MAG: magnesium and cobalt transport protein CorA [Euzebya sp.]
MLLGWFVYADGKEVDSGTSLAEVRPQRSDGEFVWIRVVEPTPGEIRELTAVFGLPELAVEDAVTAHQRPKLERYDDTVFLVLKPAEYNDQAETISLGEIHVFQGRGFCITVRHGDIGQLSDVHQRLEATPELMALGSAAVLYAVADQVVDAYIPVIQGLEVDILQIERAVFDQDQQPPTERIYGLIREVLEFQRATSNLLLPLDDLAKGRIAGVDRGMNPFFRDVADHAQLVQESAENFRELLSDALQANLAFIGLQENRDQRKISAWAAIALVPTIIGGIWGMNVGSLPFTDSFLGFPVLILIMASVSGYLYWRLHRSGWL